MDEGYIKFNCKWTKSKALPESSIADLQKWRDQLYHLKLIGAYDNGIGYGNISKRHTDSTFIISGSATGNFKKLNNSHYSLVTSFDIEQNTVSCKGPIMASSESMSHAMVYQQCLDVKAVFHIHHFDLWKRLLNKIPTSSVYAAYGTPEMAYEIIRLFEETDLHQKKIFAMAGHEEGLIAFGKNADEAGAVLLSYFAILSG